MNKPRGESEQTKTLLLQKATELFSKKGYQATTLSEICSCAGVSKGSIYFHFKNKEQLFVEVLEYERANLMERWEAAFAALAQHGTTREIARLMGRYYTDDYKSPLMQASKEFSMQGILDEKLLKRILELSTWHHPIIRRILERGMDRGEVKRQDPERLAIVVASMLDGLGLLYYSVEFDVLSLLHEQAIEIILDGIALEKE
jgi:AcrR family transcriptional regulator